MERGIFNAAVFTHSVFTHCRGTSHLWAIHKGLSVPGIYDVIFRTDVPHHGHTGNPSGEKSDGLGTAVDIRLFDVHIYPGLSIYVDDNPGRGEAYSADNTVCEFFNGLWEWMIICF